MKKNRSSNLRRAWPSSELTERPLEHNLSRSEKDIRVQKQHLPPPPPPHFSPSPPSYRAPGESDTPTRTSSTLSTQSLQRFWGQSSKSFQVRDAANFPTVYNLTLCCFKIHLAGSQWVQISVTFSLEGSFSHLFHLHSSLFERYINTTAKHYAEMCISQPCTVLNQV